jgi:UDP-GlcNAc:undecaprenyl-phosphate GlcNAc-1-phosphate transferase
MSAVSLVYAFLVATAVALAATPLCQVLALRWRVLDFPAPRKVHARPTPLLGGVAVFLGFAIATLLFLRSVIPSEVVLLLAGAAAFGVIGLADDVWNIGAVKLLIEACVVTAIVWLGGIRVNLPWPGMGEILAVLWILGVSNAVNCLDCVDGVAAGVSAIGGLALAALALVVHREGVAVAAVAISGAALGFLRYNVAPARIFLGDAGSLMLGFVLAALAAALAAPRVSTEWLAPLLVLSVPVFDFLFVHLRRYQNGTRGLRIVTSTGKDHLPHRLLEHGLSTRGAASRIYRASALMGASAVALVLWGPPAAVVPILPLAVLAVFANGKMTAMVSRGGSHFG